jgi:hypothetical protein
MHRATKSEALRAGVIVGVILGVITVVEFYLSTTSIAFVGVMTTAILKTVIILQRYMHIGSLWNEESEH